MSEWRDQDARNALAYMVRTHAVVNTEDLQRIMAGIDQALGEVEAERDALRERLARVEALAEGWAREASQPDGHPLLTQTYRAHARFLRAALDESADSEPSTGSLSDDGASPRVGAPTDALRTNPAAERVYQADPAMCVRIARQALNAALVELQSEDPDMENIERDLLDVRAWLPSWLEKAWDDRMAEWISRANQEDA